MKWVLIFFAFGLAFLPFLAYYRPADVRLNILPIIIFCLSLTAFTIITFIFTGVYRVLAKDIGMFEFGKIFAITAAIQLIGIIVVAVVDELPRGDYFFWNWTLGAVASCFALPSLRVIVRGITLLDIAVKKKDKIKTLVI